MGYRESLSVLEESLEMLEPLTQGEQCFWPTPVEEEKALAFRIREALWIARNLGAEKYPTLSKEASNYRIKITGKGGVLAVRKFPSASPKKFDAHASFPSTEDWQSRLLTTTEFDQASLITIVGILKQEKETKTFHFTDAVVTNSDLINLSDWVQSYRPDLLLFWDDTNVILKPFSEELAPLAFSPSDL